jgi:D-serine deaminase-like pyridoxal phosphate-dependent protein
LVVTRGSCRAGRLLWAVIVGMYIVQETMPQSQATDSKRAGLAIGADGGGTGGAGSGSGSASSGDGGGTGNAGGSGGAPRAELHETGVEPEALDTPGLLLDLDRLDANIRRMADLASAAGVRLRPHAKTHKTVEVARRQLAAGCDGLTVAKLGEAELLADHGVDDLLIGYPLWGARKWERLCRLAESAEVRVAADSYEVFAGISAAAGGRGLSIPVRIEVDTGFARCGVQSAEEALALAQRLSKLNGVRLVGLISFAGQTYAAGRKGAGAVATADAARLVEVAGELRAAGFEVPEISVGGTPSAAHVGKLAGITEYRPGAYVFSDLDQVALGWGTLADCALTVLATIVSRPTATRAVIDSGTKTLSSDRAATAQGYGAIRGHPDWTVVSLSEEHGVLKLPAGEGPIGTQLEIVPNHACGCLNMHDWVAAVEDGEVVDWWRVEGRGLVR